MNQIPDALTPRLIFFTYRTAALTFDPLFTSRLESTSTILVPRC
jgi:hypothetical protein